MKLSRHKITSRLFYILVALTPFITGCRRGQSPVNALKTGFTTARKVLAIPALQMIVVFVISWVFFYTAVKYGLEKAGMMQDRQGDIMAIALAVLFTLPVIYGTRNISFAVFQSWLGFLASLVLGVLAFVFMYNFIDNRGSSPGSP